MTAADRFAVGITLEVVAGNEQLAIETAGDAVRSLESPVVVHASIAREALPLFDTAAFEQMRGQTAMPWVSPCGRDYCSRRECCGCDIGDER